MTPPPQPCSLSSLQQYCGLFSVVDESHAAPPFLHGNTLLPVVVQPASLWGRLNHTAVWLLAAPPNQAGVSPCFHFSYLCRYTRPLCSPMARTRLRFMYFCRYIRTYLPLEILQLIFQQSAQELCFSVWRQVLFRGAYIYIYFFLQPLQHNKMPQVSSKTNLWMKQHTSHV